MKKSKSSQGHSRETSPVSTEPLPGRHQQCLGGLRTYKSPGAPSHNELTYRIEVGQSILIFTAKSLDPTNGAYLPLCLPLALGHQVPGFD
jgi:hypothetical protein